jgi:hypothetical protein
MRQDETQVTTEGRKKEQQRYLALPRIALDNHIETIDVIENACQAGRSLTKVPIALFKDNIRGVAHALESNFLSSGGLWGQVSTQDTDEV